MKKHLLIGLLSLFVIGCGGGGSSSNSSDVISDIVDTTSDRDTTTPATSDTTTSTTSDTDTTNLKIALSNTGTVIEETFNAYVLKVTTSLVLSETKETSLSTIAVYGTVNGAATEALLKINTNYIDSNISVAVFKDEVLVGQSETFKVSSEDAINFGEITIN